MDKICEFCTALRPVVYCKADAAYLCLSCDAKIHSANALSSRHVRNLLCDSCKNRPVYARCLDHQMFLCSSCDQSIHGSPCQHQNKTLSNFIGCPSAKDFAALCGFELDEMDTSNDHDQQFSSLQSSFSTFDIPTFRKSQGQQNNDFILQQIINLKKLQLTERDSGSSVVQGLEEMDGSSSIFKTSKNFGNSVYILHGPQDAGNNDCQLQELKRGSSPSPFSQSETSSLPSTAANPLLGEPFWQCRSPLQSNQTWHQNIQDLGICSYNACDDDSNLPDVDTTFCNFEELFGIEQDGTRALVDDKDASWSCTNKEMSVDTSQSRIARQSEDTSVASCFCVGQPVEINKSMGPPNEVYGFPRCMDPQQMIRPCSSTMSFAVSRFSAESSRSEYVDSGLSSYITGNDVSNDSFDLEIAHSEAKENATSKNKEKKRAQKQEKQIGYAPRKARTDVRKRAKGRVSAKTGGTFGGGTRSF